MKPVRSILIVASILGALSALVACAAPSASSSGGGTSGSTITLQSRAFDPSSLTVKAGATVTFRNADSTTHHIVVGTTDLGEQAPGSDKTWKAPKDGVYVMKCLIHPQMQGRITVGAGGSTVGTPPAGGGSSGGGGGGYGY